jgi:transcriptional regulator with XRE-family HTH domain
MPYTPTVRGRKLARELRRLRREANISGEDVAERLGWDQGKISRMETAKMRITAGEVMELLEVYGVEGDVRSELVRLSREARRQGWWNSYHDVLKTGFSDYLAFEAEALTYSGYEVQVVPGLFQTEDYAYAVFRGSQPRTEEETARGVEARMARQKRITAARGPLHVWTVIEEAALRRIVGNASITRAQLEHLLDLGSLANVSIQVMPFNAGIHAAIDGPFVVLTFDGYPDVLYMEHLMGCIYLEKPAETTHGKVVFDHLRASALNTGDSATLIREAAAEMTR